MPRKGTQLAALPATQQRRPFGAMPWSRLPLSDCGRDTDVAAARPCPCAARLAASPRSRGLRAALREAYVATGQPPAGALVVAGLRYDPSPARPGPRSSGAPASHDMGKRLEPRLWRSWNGSPTTRRLRLCEPGGNPVLAENYHRLLRGLLK
jgi:hypothetical protein